MKTIGTVKLQYDNAERKMYLDFISFLGNEFIPAIADDELGAKDVQTLVECMSNISRIWNKYEAEEEEK